MREDTIKTHVAFSGKLLRLEQLDVTLPDGRTAYREIVRHPGAIGVIARLPGERFVLVRQYRKAVEAYSLEIVAGLLDSGESPASAAHRELVEETGFRAATMHHLGIIYASPGYVDERIDVYLAELEDAPALAPQLDHGEHVETVIMDRVALARSITTGDIRDSKTLAAWGLLLTHEAAARAHEGLA